MNIFLNFLLHLIFIATFVFLYVVSIIILRPFRKHKKRNYSTILYKLTYLLYLATFIVLTYLVLFFSSANYQDSTNVESVYKIYYGIVSFAFIVPNMAIMFRRKALYIRRFYNIFFGFLNLIVTGSLLYIIFVVPWDF
jgi:hypothetical protein